MILHAGLIATRREGRWRGVLLQGPSGSGKSDLALRAMAHGWRLAADDRVRLWSSGGAVYGAAPPRLAGLIEVRGLGVQAAAALPFARISLAVTACEPDAPTERMPEPAQVKLLEGAVAHLRLPLREPSSLAKLECALAAVLRGEL